MVEEELDETLYWLELIVEAGLIRENLLHGLMIENEALLKIIVASINTTKENMEKMKNSKIIK